MQTSKGAFSGRSFRSSKKNSRLLDNLCGRILAGCEEKSDVSSDNFATSGTRPEATSSRKQLHRIISRIPRFLSICEQKCSKKCCGNTGTMCQRRGTLRNVNRKLDFTWFSEWSETWNTPFSVSFFSLFLLFVPNSVFPFNRSSVLFHFENVHLRA